MSKPLAGFNKNKRQTDGHRLECRECQKLAGRLYRALNKDKQLAYSKANSEKARRRSLQWYYNNLEYAKNSHKEYSKLWRQTYPHKNCKKSNDYRARKINATPSWVDKEEEFLILEVYHLAKLRTDMFGVNWHVDHIIPLKGKNVCGLHTINNLQVIPEKLNLVKSNRILSER